MLILIIDHYFFLKIGQLGEAKDQLQMIDVEHSKTQNRVEVLGQVIFFLIFLFIKNLQKLILETFCK